MHKLRNDLVTTEHRL